MNKTTNKYGKEVWEGAEIDSPFDKDMFHEVEMGVSDLHSDYDQNYQWALHTNLGSITILDRRTGFGWRDTETGYRSPEGKFWLASGGMDVRNSGCKTIGEAIEWVKLNADICEGE